MLMKTLEDKIMQFDDWSKPWTFKKSVEESLTASELNLFKEMWLKAGSFELWNNSDLKSASETSQKYLKEHYSLSAQAIANMIRALAYEWQ